MTSTDKWWRNTPSWHGAVIAHDLQSLHYQVMKQEQRVAALVDRMHTAERDIESLQKYVAVLVPRGTPTLYPYSSDNIIRPV
jgi:cell division protein FtsB